MCDTCIDIFEEDAHVTEVVNKLYVTNIKNELEVTELYEFMEGGFESASEEKISQGEDDDGEDEELGDIAENKANRDISFDVFRWFNNSTSKSPVIRYGRDILPL